MSNGFSRAGRHDPRPHAPGIDRGVVELATDSNPAPLTECVDTLERAGKLYLALFDTVYIPVSARVIGYPSHADTESIEPASPREPTMPDR